MPKNKDLVVVACSGHFRNLQNSLEFLWPYCSTYVTSSFIKQAVKLQSRPFWVAATLSRHLGKCDAFDAELLERTR